MADEDLDFDLDWILRDPDAAQIEIDRMLVKKGGLAAFIELAWHIIEPAADYSENWHTAAICQEIEDVLAGRNTRLAIGVPPRHMKSIIVAVMLPAYDWIDNPHRRYFFASYNDKLSMQDSVRCRRIIESEWYVRRWGNKFSIVTDQNEKRRFDNDKSGFRLITSVGGAATGYGADIICFPHQELVATELGHIPIGEIVEKRLAVRVWSFDPESGQVKLKPVVGWHKNPGSRIVEVGLSDGTVFQCTPDHKIWTARGWVEAASLLPEDMLPGDFAANAVDSGQAYTKFPGKNNGRKIGRKNFSDIIFGQLRARMINTFGAFHSAVRPTIFDVLFSCAITKVVQARVSTISILMQNLLKWRRRANERLNDSLVNRNFNRLVVTPCIKARVSLAWRGLNQAAGYFERFSVAENGTRQRLHAAIIRNQIKLQPNQRSPFFIREVGHATSTFCLTVADYHTFFVSANNVGTSNCVDDPHNVQGAESEKRRETVLKWFWESLPSRFNNQKKGALIVIQQRVNEADVLGSILERQGSMWRYVCLPAKFDLKAKWKYKGDPRTTEGELLWPDRFPEAVLDRLLNDLGLYAFSAQFQQAPAPREGGLFKRKWFQPTIKEHELPDDLECVRGWDWAASLKTTQKSDPDFTATVKIGYSATRQKWYIMHAARWREEVHAINQRLVMIADKDKVGTRIAMPQDPGAAGKGDAQAKAAMLSKYSLIIEPPTGDKYTRASPLAGQAGVGNVVLVEGGWNSEFLDELCGFPNASHDDFVDAASSAFKAMTGGDTGMIEYYERMMRKMQAERSGLQNATVTPGLHGHNLETDMGLALTKYPPKR